MLLNHAKLCHLHQILVTFSNFLKSKVSVVNLPSLLEHLSSRQVIKKRYAFQPFSLVSRLPCCFFPGFSHAHVSAERDLEGKKKRDFTRSKSKIVGDKNELNRFDPAPNLFLSKSTFLQKGLHRICLLLSFFTIRSLGGTTLTMIMVWLCPVEGKNID